MFLWLGRIEGQVFEWRAVFVDENFKGAQLLLHPRYLRFELSSEMCCVVMVFNRDEKTSKQSFHHSNHLYDHMGLYGSQTFKVICICNEIL